jgi:hydroxylamine reductase (hybrid-cluster protein)
MVAIINLHARYKARRRSGHTKLIGAFAREQISDILGKIEKTVHSGAIFPLLP